MTTKKATAKHPIKVGVVGLGRAGFNMHCAEMDTRKKKFRIVAGCDPLAIKRERFADKYKKANVYTTLDELLSDPEVELVSIANRTVDHVETARRALASGKDVFLEKPICETYAEALKIKRYAAQADGHLFIRHNRRFESAFAHIQQIIASGILGDIYEIKLARHSYSRRDDWQTLKSCGGGQLNNWGPHIIDHALQFLDSPVKDIWSDLKLIAAAGDAEDHLKIVLRGRNGRIVDLEISGGVAIPSPVFAVYGKRGSLVTYDEKVLKLRYLDPRKKLVPRKATKADPGIETGFGTVDELKWIEKEIKVKKKPNLFSIWDHLYDAIRNGVEFPITIDQSLAVVKVISKVKEGTKFARPKSRKTKR